MKTVDTLTGTYTITGGHGERYEVRRPSGMLLGRFNKKAEAVAAARCDDAALRGVR